MKVKKAIFNQNNFGITQRSLKELRDEMCRRIGHHAAVFLLPVDRICCAFLIMDTNLTLPCLQA